MVKTINATPANRKALRAHAREAMAAYSRIMTWVVLDSEGDLHIIAEPQGQTVYVGDDEVIATTGGFHKAHGKGAAINPATGCAYATRREYLTDLLGAEKYNQVFMSDDALIHLRDVEAVVKASRELCDQVGH